MSGADVILNTVGPYYVYGERIVKAAIEAKTNLVDVCDDGDATEKMLALDSKAKKAGVSMVVGLGATPGITNLMARTGADKLDHVDDIDTAWAWTAIDPKMTGSGIVEHYLHAVDGEVLTYKDGRQVMIPAMTISTSGSTLSSRSARSRFRRSGIRNRLPSLVTSKA
jgi:saccharopine dehydrogenase-like NADP-dependent oxidoreductase